MINLLVGAHSEIFPEISNKVQRAYESHSSKKFNVTNETFQEIINGNEAKKLKSDNDVEYYLISKNFICGTAGIYRDGRLYKRFSEKIKEVSKAAPDHYLNIHFFIEPAFLHLEKHYDKLNPAAKKNLAAGLVSKPSWIPTLLEASDSLLNGHITIWNLDSAKLWADRFVAKFAGLKVNPNKVDLNSVNVNTQSDLKAPFAYDFEEDDHQFEFDLDIIDTLENFTLEE